MKVSKTYKIETENYILRIPNEADIPSVYSATRYKGFNDGMLWEPPKNQEELLEPLKNNIKSWEEGEGYSFTIERKEEKNLLGRISIRKTNEKGIWNIGFWTHPEVQGKGVMTESLEMVLKFGVEKLSAKRIEACYAIWNKASEKVLKRNGLKFVKYIEKGFKKDRIWVEENMLAITREEWQNNKTNYNK